MHKQQNFSTVTDLLTEILCSCCYRFYIIRFASTLDILIAVSRIKCYDRNSILNRKIKLDGACACIYTGNCDHIRITCKLFIQNIHLLIDIIILIRCTV